MLSLLLAFTVTFTDPMEWLYPDSETAKVAPFAATDVAADGVADVNVLFNDLVPGTPLTLRTSTIGGEWTEMLSVPVEENTTSNIYFTVKPGETNPYAVRKAPYRVYDALRPLSVDDPRLTPTSSVAAVRFSIDASKLKLGENRLNFVFCHAGICTPCSFVCRVYNTSCQSPSPKSEFKYVNWMSCAQIAQRHNLELWSDAHWAMVDRYLALARKNRQNDAWVSGDDFFCEAADGSLDLDVTNICRYVELCKKNGFSWIEGPHLCTRGEGGWKCTNIAQRATFRPVEEADSVARLKKFCDEIRFIIDKYDVQDRWIQHVMDEPTLECINSYYRACGIVRRFLPGVPLMDAVELPGFEGALDIVCPKDYMWQNNLASFEYARTNCSQKAWVYTCCAPGGKWMNRLLDMELLRPAYIFPTADARQIEGYLHWGYNHWQRGQDPFNMSCIRNWSGVKEQTLPAGDTHVVYPGTDGPWSGVRLEATRVGMEDCELFRRLRAKDAAKADALLRRLARGFDDYEKDVRVYRQVRRELLEALVSR